MKRKCLAIGIILLFVGTCIIPSTANNILKNKLFNENEQFIQQKNYVKIYSPINEIFFEHLYPFENEEYLILGKQKPQTHQIPIPSSTLYNITITQPLNNDIFRAGDTILINGTIYSWRFKNYTVEYGEGWNSTNWQTTGISLVKDGKSPITNSTIARWNTSFVTKADFFTLKITIHRKTILNIPFFEKLITFLQKFFPNLILIKEKVTYVKNIYLDPTLKMGWPQRLHTGYYGTMMEPVVCDVNNDEQMEIFVHTPTKPHKIFAFKPDGSSLEGWPVEVTDDIGYNAPLDAPSFVDFNNDGYKDICFSGKKGIYIYNHDGSLLKFIDLYLSSQPISEIVFADVNNDGHFEIIKKYNPWDPPINGDYLAVLDSNGTMLPGWPQLFYDYSEGGVILCLSGESVPAVGHFDGDSDLEIVVAGCRNVYDVNSGEWHFEGLVHVFDLNGSVLPGFPVNLDGIIFSSPAVGDINKDGYDEIIVGSHLSLEDIYFPDYGLYVLDRFGHNCTGWPYVDLNGQGFYSSPALADFNDDGYLEIVASSGESHNTLVFNYLGNILPGWPQPTIWCDFRSPIVGDVNGDGELDVLTTAGDGVVDPGAGGVYAWSIDGIPIEGFPKVTEVDAQAAATIADIDNDGTVELIASSNWDLDITTEMLKHRGSIYVWELSTGFTQGTMEWPMFHHDIQHTGKYGLLLPIFRH
ncbi:MAG: VCBS repeat-containing protein [Euryarchaeota archaeon]|nr:VCBS repeat-containing protein [Euryarchaeota archaeon]